MKPRVQSFVNSPIFAAILIIPLSALSFFPAVLILPIQGIAAAVYGLLAKKQLRAFLVGLVPYLPLVFLGGPRAGLPLILGVPAGIMGLGGTLLGQRKALDYRAGLGILLLVLAALVWWLFLLARLSD
jgi:hypothetical protein